MFASQWFNMNRVEYDIDRRMNSLLNKSPESGYIHSRNGASGSQHLCMMKEVIFFLKSITEDINQKAATTPTMERWEREQSLLVGAAQPWHRLSS